MLVDDGQRERRLLHDHQHELALRLPQHPHARPQPMRREARRLRAVAAAQGLELLHGEDGWLLPRERGWARRLWGESAHQLFDSAAPRTAQRRKTTQRVRSGVV